MDVEGGARIGSRTSDEERADALETARVLLSLLSPPVTDDELFALTGRNPPQSADEPERRVWERQPGESPEAFAAFALYRDGGPGMSIRKVASKLAKRPQLLDRWSRKHGWVARRDAYLQDLDRQRLDVLDRQHLEVVAAREREHRELRITVSLREAAEQGRRHARRSKSARRLRPPGSKRFVPLASRNDPSHPAFHQPAPPEVEGLPDVEISEGSGEPAEVEWPPRDSIGRIHESYYQAIRRRMWLEEQERRSRDKGLS